MQRTIRASRHSVYAVSSSITSAFFSLVLLGICSMPVRADDYISPELVKVTTPFYRPGLEDFSPPMGTYNYTVSWQGISAASAAVTFAKKDDKYIVEAAAKTYSGIDLLYKLRYTATGVLAMSDLSPISLTIDHQENSRIKNIEVLFSPNSGEVSSTRTRVGSTEKKVLKFQPNNLTLDPIGAGFLARSLDWKVGESKTFDVFNGKSRYLITLTAVNRETIEHQGKLHDCFVISPRVRNLTTTKAVEKLREAFIYVTADKRRDVLKIVSSVFIGSVVTELESFVPAEVESGPLLIARSEGEEVFGRAQMR